MERLAEDRRSFRLVQVDVETWGSPVSRQFHIEQLPTLHLYQGRELVSDDTRKAIELLQQ